MKIGIVTDSIASISKEDSEKYNIQVVPANLLFEGKVYRDGIDLTAEKAYEILEKNPEHFSTSAPSAGDFLKAFQQAASEADQIICLTVSRHISATFDSARMAKGLLKNEAPKKKLEVVDTQTATVGQALLVLATARAIKEGKSFEEVIKIIENLRKKIRTFLLLETIRHIHRTGRIPEIASKIGGILKFKPIIDISGGKLRFGGMTSSKEKSIEKVLNILKEDFIFSFRSLASFGELVWVIPIP